jgi:hypothetical protein
MSQPGATVWHLSCRTLMHRRTGNLRHLRRELTDRRKDRKEGPYFIAISKEGNEIAMGTGELFAFSPCFKS